MNFRKTKGVNGSFCIDQCIYLLALLFFLKAIFLAFWITPLWDIPDETGHFAYTRNIGSLQGFPLLGEAEIEPDILSHVYGKPVKTGVKNWIAMHPPVFYILTGIVWKIGTFFTDSAEMLYRIPRVVSAFFGAATLIVIYRLLLLLNVRPVSSLGIVACLSFIPMYSHLSSGTQHDTTVTFFTALAVFFWSRYLLDKKNKDAYMFAFWLSIAAATKLSVLVLILPMVFVLFIELGPPWGARIKQVAVLLILALFLPGLWMFRHFLAFGDPLATYDSLTPSRLPEPLQCSFIEYISNLPVIDHLFRHFFGLFGWIGTGRGHISMARIGGIPLIIHAIIVLSFMLVTAYELTKRISVGFREEKDSVNGYRSLIDSAQISLKKRGLTKIFVLLIVLAVLFVAAFGFLTIYRPPGFGGSIRFLVFMMLLCLCAAAPLVFVLPLNKNYKISLYSLVIFGIFSILLLSKLYGMYLREGYMWGINGRYFYPLIPFLLMGLVLPAASLFRRKQWLLITLSIFMGLAEWMTFTQQVIPFYTQLH